MEFFDTNVLVYTIDKGEPQRRSIALQLVREAMQAQCLVISTQVMLEFYAVAMRRKLASPAIVKGFLQEWVHGAVSTTPDLLWRAFEIQQKLHFSLWDATVVQAALDAGCDVLYTEDLQDGQQIGPLKVVDPFAKGLKVHEPGARYVTHAREGSASEVDTQLRRAIARRHLVGLVCDGLRRIGEPHDYGLRNGKAQLSFYQTAGESSSAKSRSWRTLDVAGVSNVEILDEPFSGMRETPARQHLQWDQVYASVTLQPTRKRR